MFNMILMVCATLAADGTPVIEADNHEHAILLQAQASASELNGDPVHALELMRQAVQAAPSDINIAFDVARLSYARQDSNLPQDAAPFLRLTPETADQKLLRAYLLAPADTAGARSQIDDVLRTTPNQSEALLMRDMLGRMVGQPGPSIVEARVMVGADADTNVALLPQDVPSQLQGTSIVADAALRVTPLRGTFQLDVVADVHADVYVNNRTNLKPYDVLSGTGWLSGIWAPGPATLTVDLVGTWVFAGEQSLYFMRDTYAQAELRKSANNFDFAIYALGGERDFGYGNQAGNNDRSGQHYELGVLGELPLGPVVLGLRLGGLTEQTHGSQQRVAGGRGILSARLAISRLMVALAMADELRDYYDSGYHRFDQRLEPNIRVGLALSDTFRLMASYVYIDNLSLKTFAYVRQLAELGLEARW